MNALDLARTKMELGNVKAARGQLEYQKLEREHDIKRIEAHIEIQIAKEKELEAKLNDASTKG